MAEPLDRVTPPLTLVERTPPSTSPSARRTVTRERLALLGILFIGAVLDVFRLNQEGYANTYYAAAVKSMLQSWHNFFFVAFDPGGFLAVDKPPLGLWVQVASVRLLGFNGVSLLLPQALAGVLSILLLYYLVARAFGRPAGLLAALALALTPIAVVDNRNNTSDSVLILTLLLAAWAVIRATETGRLRWLLLGAVFVGLGFNIKELQAYLVLPALVLVYLLAAPRHWWVRLWHLIVAGMALLVVSFAWIVAVDLTPAGQRPYVTDSGTNSELSLALGYNGFGRLTAGLFSHLTVPFLHVKLDFSIVPAISTEIGSPGLLRLFSPNIAEQVSWLLPLALLGVVVALARSRPYLPLRREHAGLILWGTWLLTAGIFFSVARFYHLYYLIMLAPAVAALAGIGFMALWADYREGVAGGRTWWKGWALPLTLLGTALIQANVVSDFAGANGWPTWLAPVVVGVCVVVAVALVAIRLHLRFLLSPDLLLSPGSRAALLAAGIGIVSLLAAPAAWASVSAADGNGAAWLPQAGPSQGFGPGRAGFAGRFRGGPPSGGVFTPPANGSFRGGFPGAGRSGSGGFPSAGTSGARRFGGGGFGGGFGGGAGAITFAGSDVPQVDPKLLSYLETHRGTARYLVATMTTSYASLIILDTGQPVMALGGYQGWDKILTPTQLARLVANGTVRYFLISGSGGGGGAGFSGRFGGGPFGNAVPSVDQKLNTTNNDLVIWVQSHCLAVPTGQYQTISAGSGTGAGYDRGFGSSGAGTLYACMG